MALASRYEVEIIGPSKSGDIWFPMKDIDIPIRSYPWKRYPFFVSTIRKIIKDIDADILIACKLRPTSFGIALIKKWVSNIPVILDISFGAIPVPVIAPPIVELDEVTYGYVPWSKSSKVPWAPSINISEELLFLL